MTISAVLSVRNVIETGYPFVEAILSMIPIVDEYLINDGGSTDGTLEYIKRLREIYPDKVRLYTIKDYPSNQWECACEQYNKLIDDASGQWIFQGEADELMHENDIRTFKAKLEASPDEVLVYRHLRREVSNWWSEMGSYDYYPARTARNLEGIFQSWASHGGDEFLVPEWRWLREPPECQRLDGYMIWHLYTAFPENNLAKRKNDATFLARTAATRREQYEWYVEHWNMIKAPEWYGKRVVEGLPALVRHLAGAMRYVVDERLFDPQYVSELTGIKGYLESP